MDGPVKGLLPNQGSVLNRSVSTSALVLDIKGKYTVSLCYVLCNYIILKLSAQKLICLNEVFPLHSISPSPSSRSEHPTFFN